jgi:streptomycin 6-kinase
MPGFDLPSGLDWLRSSQEGRAWLRRLPGLVDACAEEWKLRLGHPFEYAYASLAVRATTPDGEPVVLKIQFPDRESEHEAAALRVLDGDGAIRLLAHDAQRHALLLERCEPGTPLSQLDPDAALDVMVGLLPRLWKPAGQPFRSLTEEAAWWAEYLEPRWVRTGRPFERKLLDAALDALGSLPASQGEQVLVHQDLHADNVLAAGREPWLVIDPKPLVGEREFGIAPLVRGGELGTGREKVVHRLERLTTELGLDRERARLWTLAQTVAWAFEADRALEGNVQTALDLVGA